MSSTRQPLQGVFQGVGVGRSASSGSPEIWLSVTDLRQVNYCKRVVFYIHRMAGAGRETFKMSEGRLAQEELEKLELRRTLRRYGLAEARRRFGLWLRSERLKLSGKLDLLLEGQDDAAVVEFKLISGDPQKGHWMQLCGYALLVEDVLGLKVSQGFLYRIPDEKVFVKEFDADSKREVLATLQYIREVIASGMLPEPTKWRKRCEHCEYINYCADVW